jgi:phosphate transport system substrate-binding protein
VPNVPSGEIRYGGSTAWAGLRGFVLPTIKKTFPDFKLVYKDPPNSRPYSEAGIEMLIASELDFAMSSHSIRNDLHQKAAEKGLKLKEVIVAVNGNAIAVHPSLNIPGLTLDQYDKILAGKITNWQQVGGPDRLIQVYSTDERYLEGVKFIEVRDATTGLGKVIQDPGGLFQASAALIMPQCNIRVLPIISSEKTIAPYQEPFVPCSDKSQNKVNIDVLRTGDYPILSLLSVVIVEDGGRRQQAGEAYANMLLSDEGQALINQSGYAAYSLKKQLSEGDKLLISQTQSPQKLAGVQAFAQKNYVSAVSNFTESLRFNQNDPETLIYLNNAQIRLYQRPSYRIAVEVPIGTGMNVAEEILRGVAQAQEEAKANGIGIEVVIVDDRNNPAIAQQMATELIKDLSILAVVGHNTAQLWGGTPVNWQTGTAYDATQAIIKGLAQRNTREGLRDVLLKNFSTEGSSSEVQLSNRGLGLRPVLLQVKDGKFTLVL